MTTLHKFISFIFISIISLSAIADVPFIMNYQGVLTDNDGQPLDNTSVTLEFNIYEVTDTSSKKYWGPQTFKNVTVNKGQFNIILGPLDENPNPPRPLEWAFRENLSNEKFFRVRDPLFIEIKVTDSNGVSYIPPKQRLLSAPYAIYSHGSLYSAQSKNTKLVKNRDVTKEIDQIKNDINKSNQNIANVKEQVNTLGFSRSNDCRWIGDPNIISDGDGHIQLNWGSNKGTGIHGANNGTGPWFAANRLTIISQCPANYYMAGIALQHANDENGTHEQRHRLYCCQVK